ncbi:MAG: twin-arginine translocation signal domain-containing protein, partial [Chthoniobacterales bacterium]
MTRRKFLRATTTGGAIVLAGGLPKLAMAAVESSMGMRVNKTFPIGGDLTVNRLGFGAMRITGAGIWGWP